MNLMAREAILGKQGGFEIVIPEHPSMAKRLQRASHDTEAREAAGRGCDAGRFIIVEEMDRRR
jgi:hypothetical protein